MQLGRRLFQLLIVEGLRNHLCAISLSLLSLCPTQVGPSSHWASYVRRTRFRGLLLIPELLLLLFKNPFSTINPDSVTLYCSRAAPHASSLGAGSSLSSMWSPRCIHRIKRGNGEQVADCRLSLQRSLHHSVFLSFLFRLALSLTPTCGLPTKSFPSLVSIVFSFPAVHSLFTFMFSPQHLCFQEWSSLFLNSGWRSCCISLSIPTPSRTKLRSQAHAIDWFMTANGVSHWGGKAQDTIGLCWEVTWLSLRGHRSVWYNA